MHTNMHRLIELAILTQVRLFYTALFFIRRQTLQKSTYTTLSNFLCSPKSGAKLRVHYPSAVLRYRPTRMRGATPTSNSRVAASRICAGARARARGRGPPPHEDGEDGEEEEDDDDKEDEEEEADEEEENWRSASSKMGRSRRAAGLPVSWVIAM